MLRSLIDHLLLGRSLSDDQVTAAVTQLTDESVPSDAKADFLSALARKGETVEEIAAFARILREKSVPVPIPAALRQTGLLDVVGTGGDQLGTFNVSTCAALIAASAGVRVAKHGNRAVTSKVGSADVIETLGFSLEQSPEKAAAMLGGHGFAFFFAPRYHPAFRHIAPARKLCAERGQSTIFNFLGPLLNPARPTAMLVGVPRPEMCEPLARALRQLGVRRGMVVSGTVPADPDGAPDRLDEFSTLGETLVAEFYHEHAFSVSVFSPGSFPVQPATLDDLRGGDRAANAWIVRQVLSGQDRGPRRDAVLLNAGAALFVADRVRNISEGWSLAAETIDGGRAAAKLEELVAASRA